MKLTQRRGAVRAKVGLGVSGLTEMLLEGASYVKSRETAHLLEGF